MSSVFTPAKLAFAVGAIGGFLLCPLAGVWAVGTAIATGLAVGYGAKWGGALGNRLAASLYGVDVSKYYSEDTCAPGSEHWMWGSGYVESVTFAATALLAVGYICGGGVAAYYARAPIRQFFQQEIKINNIELQQEKVSTPRLPSRSGTPRITAEPGCRL
jgi:hypothetical protein